MLDWPRLVFSGLSLNLSFGSDYFSIFGGSYSREISRISVDRGSMAVVGW